jgi:GNAT superfamily N-acetyltransferase
MRVKDKRGERLKVYATTDRRDVDMMRGWLEEHCQKQITGSYVAKIFSQKHDRPRLYFSAMGDARSGVATTRGKTIGPLFRGFAVVTLMHERSGESKLVLELVCSNAGAGSALIEAILSVARDLKINLVQLMAASKGLVPYYERFGFARIPNACDSKYLRRDGTPRPLSSFPYVPGKTIRTFQYVRSKTGWRGEMDGAAPRHSISKLHKDGETEGYLMSSCLRRAKKKKTKKSPR